MKIRKADKNDLQLLDKMLTKLIVYEAQFDNNINIDYVVENNYNDILDMEQHIVYVAEVDNIVVGFLYGFVYQIPKMWKQPIAIIDALYVEQKYRQQGFALALIEEFEKFAKLNNACRVELKVITNNSNAYNLYKKANFQEHKKYMYKSI